MAADQIISAISFVVNVGFHDLNNSTHVTNVSIHPHNICKSYGAPNKYSFPYIFRIILQVRKYFSTIQEIK